MAFRKKNSNPFEELIDQDDSLSVDSEDGSKRSSVRELATNFERLKPSDSSTWTKSRTISGSSTLSNPGLFVPQSLSAPTSIDLKSSSQSMTQSVSSQSHQKEGDESDPFADDHAAYSSSSSDDNSNRDDGEREPIDLNHLTVQVHESQYHNQYPSDENIEFEESRSSRHHFNNLSQSLDVFSPHSSPSSTALSPPKPVVPPRPQRTPARSPHARESEFIALASGLLSQSSPDIRPPLPPRPSASRGGSPEHTKQHAKPSAATVSQGDLLGHTSLPRAPVPPIPDRPQHRYKTSASETALFPKQPEDRFSQLKTKEKIHIPITRYANRRLPIVESLVTTEIPHKGAIKTLAYSRLYAVTGTNTIKIWYLPTGENTKTVQLGDTKVFSVCFLPNVNMDLDGHQLWVGVDRGEIISIDIHSGDIVERRGLHNAPVIHMFRQGIRVFTLDENGGLKIWTPNEFGTLSLTNRPRGLRIGPKVACTHVIHQNLWACTGKQIELYSLEENVSSVFLKRFDVGLNAASVACIASIPCLNQVYLGHEDGKISIYDSISLEKRRVVHVGIYRITSMLGLPENQHLWVGFGTGRLAVYDPARLGNESTSATEDVNQGWIVLKDFSAYQNAAVSGIVYDDSSLAVTGRQNLITFSENGLIRIWDGLLTKDRADATMKELQRDFCDYEPIRMTLLTWNIDSRKPADLETDAEDRQFLSSFVAEHDGSEIFVFSFQELIDLESKSENAKQLFKTNNQSKEKANVDQRFKLWQDRLSKALIDTYAGAYRLLECRQLVGLFQCIFVKSNMSFSVTDAAVTQVKTGLGGYHGNKGAIATRFFVNHSSFCVVNSHLAAHQSHISARNNDIANILKEAQFPKVSQESVWEQGGDGSMILDHENVFWMGDLNYRIDMARPAVIEKVRRLDWSALWENDQLLKQKKENPSFGLRDFEEGPLAFAPTFKYDRGTNSYDSSEKMRIPAYCDRILWRGNLVKQTFLNRYEVKISDHRPVAASFIVQVKQMDRQRLARVLASQAQQVNTLVEDLVVKAKVEWISRALSVTEQEARAILNVGQGDLKYVLDYYLHEAAAASSSGSI